jgi:hypothetical protein
MQPAAEEQTQRRYNKEKHSTKISKISSLLGSKEKERNEWSWQPEQEEAALG